MNGFMDSCELVKRIKEIQTGENGDKLDVKKLVKQQQEDMLDSAFIKKEDVRKISS
jgi:hypothetical protein